MFEKKMPGKKYPFIIPNSDRGNKNGIDGMKHFIVQDNNKAIRKGIELAN